MEKVKVRVPATSANLGSGFDVFGIALNLYNYIEIEETSGGLEIEIEGENKNLLETSEDNIVYTIVRRVFDEVGYESRGIRINLYNNIPVARGLGSSASALVGGAVAANRISGSRLTADQLINIAAEIEGHSDNVVPAMMGGITICIKAGGEIIHRKIRPPSGLKAVAAVPDFELSTSSAREILPPEIALKDAVYNVGRSAMLVYAVQTGELELLRYAMEDKLHQQYRLSLVPSMEEVFSAAREAGALGTALSGAGPTLIAFASEDNTVEELKTSMYETFREHGINSKVMKFEPDFDGAVILNDGGE